MPRTLSGSRKKPFKKEFLNDDDNKLVDDALVAKDSESSIVDDDEPERAQEQGEKEAVIEKANHTPPTDEDVANATANVEASAIDDQITQQQTQEASDSPKAKKLKTKSDETTTEENEQTDSKKQPDEVTTTTTNNTTNTANISTDEEATHSAAAARPLPLTYFGYPTPFPYPPEFQAAIDAATAAATATTNVAKDGNDKEIDAKEGGTDSNVPIIPGQFPYPAYGYGYPYFYGIPGQQPFGLTPPTANTTGGSASTNASAAAAAAAAAAVAAAAGPPFYPLIIPPTGSGGKSFFPYPTAAGRPAGSPGSADNTNIPIYPFIDAAQHPEIAEAFNNLAAAAATGQVGLPIPTMPQSLDRKGKGIKRKRRQPPGEEGSDDGEQSSGGRPAPGVTSNDRPYACSFEGCHWAFARLSDQRRHMRSHQKPTFHCPYWSSDPTCHRNGGAFNRLDVLKRHLKLVHFVQFKQSDSGWCRLCQKMFPSPKHFVEHCERCAQSARPTEWKVDTGRVVVQNGPKGRSVTITDAILGSKDPTLLSMADVDTELKAKQEEAEQEQARVLKAAAEAAAAASASVNSQRPGDDVASDVTAAEAVAVAAAAAAAANDGTPTDAEVAALAAAAALPDPPTVNVPHTTRRGRGVGTNRQTLSQSINAGSHASSEK